jgi:hypothetical protein
MNTENTSVTTDYPVVVHWIIPGENLSPNTFPLGNVITLTKAQDALTPIGVSVVQDPKVNFPTVHTTAISLTYAYQHNNIADSDTNQADIYSSPPKHLALRFPWPHQQATSSNSQN